jgi:hypothetical protein
MVAAALAKADAGRQVSFACLCRHCRRLPMRIIAAGGAGQFDRCQPWKSLLNAIPYSFGCRSSAQSNKPREIHRTECNPRRGSAAHNTHLQHDMILVPVLFRDDAVQFAFNKGAGHHCHLHLHLVGSMRGGHIAVQHVIEDGLFLHVFRHLAPFEL